MRTSDSFDERLAAWLDDRLTGESLAAFERELAGHPDAEALRAEKLALSQMGSLLREYLPALPLTNPDFFNLQIQRAIAAEAAPAPVAPAGTGRWEQILSWFPGRLLAAGAACLLLAGLGISTLILPSTAPRERRPAVVQVPGPDPSPVQVAVQPPAPGPVNVNQPDRLRPLTGQNGQVIAVNDATPPPASAPPGPGTDKGSPGDPVQMANNQHQPDLQLSEVLQTRFPEPRSRGEVSRINESKTVVLSISGLDAVRDVEDPAVSPGPATPPPPASSPGPAPGAGGNEGGNGPSSPNHAAATPDRTPAASPSGAPSPVSVRP